MLAVRRSDVCVHVEPVAMLEAQRALVHRLQTGPAAHREGERGGGPEECSTARHGKGACRPRTATARDYPAFAWVDGGFWCYLTHVFTGLVETTGTLGRRTPLGEGFRIGIVTSLGPLTLGESVSVSGACLTVVSANGQGFEADVSVETSERTILGSLATGERVNLERAVAAGDRLGGHLVTGHVDGIATITSLESRGEATRVVVEPPPELLRLIAGKGSVALDGVSLTVNRAEGHRFDIMLIPHTMAVTTLGSLFVGRKLNLEVDLVARYVVRYLEAALPENQKPGLEAALARAGFIR